MRTFERQESCCSMKSRLRNCGLGWIGATLLCWLFYSKDQPEQIAAAGVIALGVILSLDSITRYSGIIPDIQWRLVRRFLLRLPLQMVIGITQVFIVLCRSLVTGTRPIGSFQETTFPPESGKTTPGRRALILMAVSITPNTFAISFQNANRLLFHQLTSTPRSPAGEWQL